MTEYLSSIGPAVGNHLWQTTAFAAVVLAAALLLRRNAARVRYGLWLAASLKFLLPFSLLIGLGGMLPRPQRAVVAMPVYSAVDAVALPFSEMPVEAAPVVARPSRMQRIEHLLPAVLLAVWLCGAAVVLTVWCMRWRQVARTLRRAARMEDGREAALLRQAEAAMGARARPAQRTAISPTPSIPLLLSRELMEPGIFGIFRPVLIWPERLTERLDDEQIEAILAHELMHVRRRDNLTAALHMFVEAAFWFHPMVWWMGRRMVEERERACDEAVVEMGSRPGVYAESLLKACRFCVESPLTCVAGITGADLTRRVRSIMTLRLERMGWGRKLLLLVFALAAVAVPVLLGQAGAAQRMMLEAVNAAPAPFRAAAHAMMAEVQTPSTGVIAAAQDDEALGPEFEVASIRPSAAGDNGFMPVEVMPSGRVTAVHESLQNLVYFAYLPHVEAGLVQGGPSWASSEEFDINAKVDDAEVATWGKLSGDERLDRIRPMMRTLLAERFHLKLHTETQVKPVYALVQAKGGVKLNPDDAALNVDPEAMKAWEKSGRTPENEPPGTFLIGWDTWTGRALPIKTLMGEIAANAHLFDRPVVNESGLKGNYDFTFKWSHDKDGPTLLDQIENQLGLKLELRKLPVKIYIIDSAEKPSVDGAEVSAPQAAPSPSQTAPMPTPVAAPVKLPAFDVVSVRTSAGCAHFGIIPEPDGLSVTCQSVKQMMEYAYGLPFNTSDRLITGAPEWADSANFDVQLKLDEASAAAFRKLPEEQQKAQREFMLRTILADHFQLNARRETRETPVYALVVAKDGFKLKEAIPNQPDIHGTTHDGAPATPGVYGTTVGMFTGHAVPISALVNCLNLSGYSQLDRIVVDRTRLTNKYDIYLTWAWTPRKAGDAAAVPGPPIFTTVQEQLGLELEARTEPMETIVIESVDRPSEN